MKWYAQFRVALVGVALLSLATLAPAQAPAPMPGNYVFYDVGATDQESEDGVESASCSCEPGNCGCSDTGGCGCGGVGCRGGCTASDSWFQPLAGRQGGWFVGADYLNVRANFSEATAFVQRDTANFIDTHVQFDFDYASSYRLYGGYRLWDCCGEITFTYTRMTSDGAEACGPVPPGGTTQCVGPLEVLALLVGDTLQARASVDLKTYDIEFSRTIPLGSPLADGSGCSTCNACDWCPAWDIKWFAGVRVAQVGWVRDAMSFDVASAVRQTGRTAMEFEGGGLRLGLDGRRYIGRTGWASVFAKGTLSVLLGDVNYWSVQTDAGTPGVAPITRANFTRIIPVTELEAGGSVHFGGVTVSAGYLLHAWHDLGMGDQYDFGLQLQYDDANILGFDGWFCRAEYAF